MLFSSYEFLFAFLPVTLTGYFAVGRLAGKRAAILWLCAASLFFYGWWDWRFAGMLAASIVANWAVGRILVEERAGGTARRALLAAGVAGNLAVLGYFKYAGFIAANLGLLSGQGFSIGEVVLPIGLSFYTFQQIAFLIDAYRGDVTDRALSRYFLFVSFFPHLIAGPIVHHRDVMPQYGGEERPRFEAANLALGLSIFAIGLFKKAVLAETSAMWADPVFWAAAQGTALSLAEAWAGSLAFAFQLYFDFSGYSDMALGLARMFGITLPINFQSPFRSASIVEFWQRWHITLGRFFTAYLYTPLTINAVRRRAAKGGAVSASAVRSPGEFLARLAWPTLLTMFAIGLWHGAGYQFLIFGLLHGVYLVVNQAWRALRRTWPVRRPAVGRPLAVAVTFVAVLVSFVFFRSATVGAALGVLAAMFGFNGVSLGRGAARLFAAPEALVPLGIRFDGLYPNGLLANVDSMGVWLAGLLLLVMAAPNVHQIFRLHAPTLGVGVQPEAAAPAALRWGRTIPWALVTGLLFTAAVIQMQTLRPFIYFQF